MKKLGNVGLNALNVATGVSFDCIAKNVTLSGNETAWHNCDNPNAQFKFDLGGNFILMRETWSCGHSSVT